MAALAITFGAGMATLGCYHEGQAAAEAAEAAASVTSEGEIEASACCLALLGWYLLTTTGQ